MPEVEDGEERGGNGDGNEHQDQEAKPMARSTGGTLMDRLDIEAQVLAYRCVETLFGSTSRLRPHSRLSLRSTCPNQQAGAD
ncbi:hypothetical protein CALVIDRAFT_571468, partial [Calocera viscosa TUFC12733]